MKMTCTRREKILIEKRKKLEHVGGVKKKGVWKQYITYRYYKANNRELHKVQEAEQKNKLKATL